MNDKQPLFSLLCRLWMHVSGRRRVQLVALGGLMLLGTAAEVISLGMVLPFLGVITAPDRIFEHPLAQPIITGLGLTTPQQLLLPLAVTFAFAAVCAGATRLALLWTQTRLGNAIGIDLGVEAYRRTLYQPYVVHAMRNSSEVVAGQVSKITTIVYYVIIPSLNLVTSAFIVTVVVSLMIWVEPVPTLVTIIGLGALYSAVFHAAKRRLAEDSQRVAFGQSHLTQVVQEGLGGIRDVLIDGLQETYLRIYRQVDTQMRRAHANITILGGAPRPVLEALALVLIGGLAYSMSSRPGGMATALPMLGTLALAAQRLLPLVQQGYAGWASMLGGQSSLRDVLRLLEQPLCANVTLPPPTAIPFREHITLHNLRFRYSPQSPWVLNGIDLQIPRGSWVGFIGQTGSGKSTLLDIVMGLLTPTSGTLCIDGTVVDESNRRSWQLHIAHVPQAIYLADTSIAENIAFGLPPEAIDHDRVRKAAQTAQIASAIESWQHGYNSFVGERGVRLSGGQRQRIGIARALYKRADVIIFDEATSALDSDTELAVMEAIDSLAENLTIIVVAHRLGTLKNCDRIFELDGGVVARVGTFQNIVGRAV